MHSINGSKTDPKVKNKWRTPQYLFDYLDSMYDFNLDAYASEEDKLCPNFIGESDNAHTANWSDYTNGDRVVAFCNPPYSQPNIKLCLEAARREARKGSTAVVLIPTQPSQYWNDLVIGQADRVLITMGRVSFVDPISGDPISGNAGGSAILTYLPRGHRVRHVHTATDYILIENMLNTTDA